MTSFEWWYDLGAGFVAPADLLAGSFHTRVGGYEATVLLPALAHPGGLASFLAPPIVEAEPIDTRSEEWGTVYMVSNKHEPIGVIVRRLVLTADVDPGHLGEFVVARTLVDAMDGWWDNVRTWAEIVTGQRMTKFGSQAKTASPKTTPIWRVSRHGSQREMITYSSELPLTLDPVHGVDSDVLKDCLALAEVTPPLAWSFLCGARSLHEGAEYRRAVIDAATAAELAITRLLDERSANDWESITKMTLGRKANKLKELDYPVPQSFFDNLVRKRNKAVHDGETIDRVECDKAIVEAVNVIHDAYPLPRPPGRSQPIRRLW
ncbi:hypothetical protein [Mycolicibacterium sp. 120270]|uniref:hypothetical protein n=1 Tax=Mycolicibacterium sp. 120270 TaxID=3090600 RepID=UPI00299F3C5C|nr:hypothetical protein [Mycolicibacterium sp. 120270]MDX1885369.1 hypothetical protein [Mycolicibacterium sp. 120270]